MITLYKANLTNYEVRFSIISILNDGIEKKIKWKKKDSRQSELTCQIHN
jgi:hypothetical protein